MRELCLNGAMGPIILSLLATVFINRAVASDEGDRDKIVEGLRGQVRNLSEALVDAKIENDLLRVRLESRTGEVAESIGDLLNGSAMLREKEYLILDVNKELGMVILNGGRRDGIKPGLMFDVIDGDKSVTTVRVVDSRSVIAGAVILDMNRKLPKVQDRALLAAGSKN